MAKTNKIQQTKKALIEALEKSLGVVTTACRSVGIDRSTFYDYLKKDEEFAAAVKELENVALDFAESKLHAQISKGDTTATIFYLKTKAKHRGYVERLDVTTGGEKINTITQVEIIHTKKTEDDD